MIPDGYSIRYKQNPYCDLPCNTISLVWYFPNKKPLWFQHIVIINYNVNGLIQPMDEPG